MGSEDLQQLVYEIEGLVETVTTDPNIPNADLRRILSFIAKVAQVIDQAFQDVFSILIEFKYLTKDELNTGRIRELQKQLDLLQARSRYRDAEEICSRLHHLRTQYESQIRPVISHLGSPAEWQHVLWLIEEREGRIIMLVHRTTYELAQMLNNLDESTVFEVNKVATQQAEVIKTSLQELRTLSNEIMGLSGRAGFLELTADRTALTERTNIFLSRGAMRMGDTFNMSGDFRNAILNIKSTLVNVRQSISTIPNTDTSVKENLRKLVDQLDEELQKVPPEKSEQAEAVAESAKILIETVNKEKPNKTMVQVSAEGLKQAAKNLAAVTPIVLTIATQIVDTVLKFAG